jgi:AraC-like DNA-binding protein
MSGRIDAAEAFLASRVRPVPDEAMRVRDLVERIERDRSIVRVSDVASLHGVDVRALQRSFRRYVGATPKWVICRYRLHEAAERLRSPRPPSFVSLAASLGYADQAHFAREFKQTVGRTPRAYMAQRPGR